MNVHATLDLLSAVCLLLGAFLSVAAGVGLVRFPDALSRMHAATKPQILGLIFVVIAIALQSRSWSTLLMLVPVVLFQMLTAPISAHMVGRAGYRTGNFRSEIMLVDELEGAVERATARPEQSSTLEDVLVADAADAERNDAGDTRE
jgi:multicomponent Na+:H+ antiporter subunit G